MNVMPAVTKNKMVNIFHMRKFGGVEWKEVSTLGHILKVPEGRAHGTSPPMFLLITSQL